MEAKNPVVWFEIYVENLKRAKSFYEKVLNITLSDLPMPENADESMKMLAFPMDMDGKGAAGAFLGQNGRF